MSLKFVVISQFDVICSSISKNEQTLEAHARSVDDHLISGLSSQLKAGASYVTDRRSVTYFPKGGNSYSPTGVKVIQVLLLGDQRLDPSAVKMVFRLQNTGTDPLTPLAVGPHGFLRRFSLICGNRVIEDIDNHARCVEMFQMLLRMHLHLLLLLLVLNVLLCLPHCLGF
jgi:hypothetical protein